MKVTVLGSGSQGNCTLIETDKTVILVDAGLSYNQIDVRMRAAGMLPELLSAVLISHEHGDHCAGLKQLCKRLPDVAIYSNVETACALVNTTQTKNWRVFGHNTDFEIGDFDVEAFSVPHDAVNPVGFSIHHNSRIAAVLTDLGHVDDEVIRHVQDASLIVLEANYDARLLSERRDIPIRTMQRIASTHGHLSNRDAAGVVAGLANMRLERAILAHLSGSSNSPELAMQQVQKTLDLYGCRSVELSCAQQRLSTPTYTI